MSPTFPRSSCLNFDFLYSSEKRLLIFSLHMHCPLLPSVGYTTTHREDTTKATRSHSWLIYTAAIHMRIAEDVWWFSNLRSCHWEMGRADPCHPHSASQTAPHLHLNLSLLAHYPQLCHLLALQMSGWMLHIHIPTHPQGGGDLHTAARYNVMLSLGKGFTLTCDVKLPQGQTEN